MDVLEAIVALAAFVTVLAFVGVAAIVAGVDSRPTEPVRWI
jgi:hypothetical protein